jgi:hypothetical protein
VFATRQKVQVLRQVLEQLEPAHLSCADSSCSPLMLMLKMSRVAVMSRRKHLLLVLLLSAAAVDVAQHWPSGMPVTSGSSWALPIARALPDTQRRRIARPRRQLIPEEGPSDEQVRPLYRLLGRGFAPRSLTEGMRQLWVQHVSLIRGSLRPSPCQGTLAGFGDLRLVAGVCGQCRGVGPGGNAP